MFIRLQTTLTECALLLFLIKFNLFIYELHHEKTYFCICETKTKISYLVTCGNRAADQRLCFLLHESAFKKAGSIENTRPKWLWTEMVMGRNGSGPKLTSHRQFPTADTFILKFLPVSEFRRHNSECRKN